MVGIQKSSAVHMHNLDLSIRRLFPSGRNSVRLTLLTSLDKWLRARGTILSLLTAAAVLSVLSTERLFNLSHSGGHARQIFMCVPNPE